MNQYVFDYGHRPATGEEDFLVAESNAEAMAWIDRWPDWDSRGLAIWGPAGSGKSHLAEIWSRRSGARHVSAAELGMALFETWPAGDGHAVLEDLGEGYREPDLFHFVNLVREDGGCLMITDRTPPARWKVNLPDLRSRLAALPAVAIGRPEDSLIAAVLEKQFRDRQLNIGKGVIAYLVTRMERSFSAITEIVGALDRLSLVEKRTITVPQARRVLEAAQTDCQALGNRRWIQD